MKPVAFDYERPDTLETACQLLAEDDEARIIAGGQTLLPMLAMRLARPSRLIDISRIAELAGIDTDGAQVMIGATTRHREVESSALVAEQIPLLAAVMPWVGHRPIRARGTVGGSVANADPAAEIPLVLVTLGGEVVLASSGGERTVAAGDFFTGPMMTDARPDECLRAVRFPIWRHDRIGVGFREVASRRSDFAIASAAAQVALADDGTCFAAAAGIGGVVGVPLKLEAAAEQLVGSPLDASAIEQFAQAVTADLPAMADPHISASYRKRAAARLLAEALTAARDDALSSRGS